MAQSEQATEGATAPTLVYRVVSGILRLWFALFFRKIRVLGAERLPASGPALLAVGHPPGFLDALILVSAVERPLSCLLPRDLLRSSFSRLMASWLGMVLVEQEGTASRVAVETVGARLARGEAMAVFAEPRRAHEVSTGRPGLTCAALAVEAETRHKGHLGLVVLPVHLFLPVSKSHSGELLVHIDRPLSLKSDIRPGERVQALAAAVEKAWQQNAFRLDPRELDLFLSDLEEFLRSDLEEDWASRPDWRQKVDGFQLSGFVSDWSRESNTLNPGRLVALREALDDYRARARRRSLEKFGTEAASWTQSSLRRASVWIESAPGWPLAFYGLLNHLLAWIVLRGSGLLKPEDGRGLRVRWALRAVAVVGCYGVQVLGCGYFLGRAAAGYYAPTLPLAGAYLWRYRWLLRHRTRPALVAALLPGRLEKLRQRRKELIEELSRALSSDARALKVPL